MASNSSKPSQRNWQAPHEGRTDEEKWKKSPSTETTHDEGVNEKLTQERRVEENAPQLGSGRTSKRRSPSGRTT